MLIVTVLVCSHASYFKEMQLVVKIVGDLNVFDRNSVRCLDFICYQGRHLSDQCSCVNNIMVAQFYPQSPKITRVEISCSKMVSYLMQPGR